MKKYLAILFLAAGQGLRGLACTHHHQHSDRDNGNEDGQQHLAHLCPQFHHTGGSGHEQQREDACEIGSNLFHIVQLYQLEVQRCQQQHQTVDAGRDRQWQHYMKDLAQKTKRKNARKLKNIFRNGSLLSRSPKNVEYRW